MIYAIQYATMVKRAFGDKAATSSPQKLQEELHLDPEISKIDVLIIGPRDVSGLSARGLVDAINEKHKDMTVIFMYTKDREVFEFESDVNFMKVKKVTSQEIKDAVQDILNEEGIQEKDTIIISNDAKNLKEDSEPKNRFGFSFGKKKPKDGTEEDDDENNGEEEIIPDLSKEDDKDPELLVEEENDTPVVKSETETVIDFSEMATTAKSLEERVKDVTTFQDWDAFKKSMDKDALMRELLGESAQFAGALNMLDVLDKQIQVVFKDTTRSSEEKFQEIRTIALQRSAYKDIQNNAITEKLCRIMEQIVVTAEKNVNNRLSEIKGHFEEISKVKIFHSNRKEIHELVQSRLKLQVELHELMMGIIDIYRTMDHVSTDFMSNFDKGLPSENEYINNILAGQRSIFTPKNVTVLVSQILSDLQNHQITLSVLENRVNECIVLLFKLCDMDTDIIVQQDRFIRLLESQRVEDVVIIDSVLKNCMRMFVGVKGSGLHATAITHSGVKSRTHNTLIVDLTGQFKYGAYGMESITLDTFLNNKIERGLLAVEADIKDHADLGQLINKLNESVGYYAEINLILTNDQIEYIKELSKSALTVHYVVNSTADSIAQMAHVIKEVTTVNIATKVVLIDPIDSMWMLEQLNVDPLLSKLIHIPHISKMRECALHSLPPYNHPEIADVFEMAFR